MRARTLSAAAGLAAAVLTTAALTGAIAPASAAPAGPPAVAGRAAALYDPSGGGLLYGKNADLELPVGSLTKIMTALLALRWPAGTVVVPGGDAAAMPPTRAGIVPGHSYTLGALLPVMIVLSANDIAVAVADALAGSTPAFAVRMNAEAAALGLRDTHFVDPNGLDAPGQHSSARDVAVLAAAAMADPGFRRLAGLRTATLPGGPTFRTLNPFLASFPGADGVKTGFTSTAGFCLAASATWGGRRLIAVVLREPSWAAAVRDAGDLITWGFARAGVRPPGSRPPAAAGPTAPSHPPAPAPKRAASRQTRQPPTGTTVAPAATPDLAGAPTGRTAPRAGTVPAAGRAPRVRGPATQVPAGAQPRHSSAAAPAARPSDASPPAARPRDAALVAWPLAGLALAGAAAAWLARRRSGRGC